MENKLAVAPPNGPRQGGGEPVIPMSKARATVLARLRLHDATLSVEQLSAETGQHPNTVREHLEALVETSYATRTAAPKVGRGRPAWQYQASASPAGPVGYAALAAALAKHIALHSHHPAAEGEAAGRAWAQALKPAGNSPDNLPEFSAATAPEGGGAAAKTISKAAAKTARSGVSNALVEAGFGVQKNRDATELVLTTCPIVEAARDNPEVVCAVHLGLVKGLLTGSGLAESEVELLPFSGPGRCTLHLPLGAAAGTQATGKETTAHAAGTP
ncbi:putative ArsR family transcriptional regulator [Arthrobacter sp. UYCu511]|uniref:helix-turn-helix transcriptional regulator n=1 Tax=Arthrobacter sp. UYCu511 TaxID=3156337 RepID=UPI003398D2C6